MMDFPTAWAIARRTPPEQHHPACSFNLTQGGLLCDCAVLYKHPQYLADSSSGTEAQSTAPPETRAGS